MGDAKELGAQTLEIMKRILEEEHLLTLNAMDNLSTTLKSLGKDDEAIKLMS